MEKEESERMQQIFKSLGFDSEECSLAEKLIMMFTDGIIGDINLLSNPILLKNVYKIIRLNIEEIEMIFGKFNYLYSSIGILCNLTYSQINSVNQMFSILLKYPNIKKTDLQIFKTGLQIIEDKKLNKFAKRVAIEKGLLYAYKMISQKVKRAM